MIGKGMEPRHWATSFLCHPFLCQMAFWFSPVAPRHGFFSSATSTERITLYYDPDNPRVAVLHPGDETAAVYGMTFGGMLAAIFSMLIFMLAPKLFKPLANG